MCKEELNEIENVEQGEEISIEDMDREDLINLVCQLVEENNKEIFINTENVEDSTINRCKFDEGVDSMSFIAGQFSTLNSVGYPKDMIHEIILNRETIEHNQYLQKINNESSERISKNQVVSVEKAQI